MIGIKQIASYIPEGRESNRNKKIQFGITDEFIEEKIGALQLSRKSANEETSDLCCRAYEGLLKNRHFDPSTVDCLVVCTQNPDGDGLPHTSAIVHGKLDLPDSVAAFDISLGCSGYVYSLAIVTSFMQAHGLSKGLLFTADPYSKIVDPNDKNTSLIFGDAATVTLLQEDPVFFLEKTRFGTSGKLFQTVTVRDGKLEMNGREIFNFCMSKVPEQIAELLLASRLSKSEIDLFLLHQGSKFIVDSLVTRMGLPTEKVPLMLMNQGNTVSSSIPLLLESIFDRKDYKRILLSGFGMGLSFASALLQRKLEKEER